MRRTFSSKRTTTSPVQEWEGTFTCPGCYSEWEIGFRDVFYVGWAPNVCCDDCGTKFIVGIPASIEVAVLADRVASLETKLAFLEDHQK